MQKQKIIATNDTIKQIIDEEIKKYGINADLNHIDTSQVTDFSYLFHGSQFNGDISQWNVSNAKDFSFLFHGSQFNGNISQWDVGNAKYMSFMFSYSQFNGDISNWNITNVQDMECMFFCSRFNQNISQWNINDSNKHFLNLRLNITSFSYYQSFLDLLKNKVLIHPINLFYFPDEIKSYQEISKFIDFVKGNQLEKGFNSFTHYLLYIYTGYPLFCCNIFDFYESSENFEDLEKNNMLISKLNIFEDILYIYFKKNLDLLFYLLFIRKNIPNENYLRNLNIPSMEEIFCQDYTHLLNKFNELVKILNKNIEELPCFNFIVNEFFKMEKQFICKNNSTYLKFISQNNLSFSHFYPYYSIQQKQDLINISSNFNTENNLIFKDLKINMKI